MPSEVLSHDALLSVYTELTALDIGVVKRQNPLPNRRRSTVTKVGPLPVPLHSGQLPVPEQSGHFGSGEFKCVFVPVPKHPEHLPLPSHSGQYDFPGISAQSYTKQTRTESFSE